MDKKKPLTEEQRLIRELSDRIVNAQKPIRILDAIKWDAGVRENFFKKNAKELPDVTPKYYEKIVLAYDIQQKCEEFYEIERDIKRQLGQYSDVGDIMLRMCREYRTVIRMLEKRGTPEFSKISQELYGSSEDVFYAGAPTMRDLANVLSSALAPLKEITQNENDIKNINSEQAVKILQSKLNEYFTDPNQNIRVELSDGIIADAAAGAEVIKIRQDAMFCQRDLKVLEVHEGWVHVGTTLNGMAQPICTFLSKGPPTSTITQEGLAIIMELFTFSSFPDRVVRLTNRVNAIYLVEEGANFLDVYNFYLGTGMEKEQAYTNTTRVFRGSTPDGQPFTKDLSYSKGFIAIYNYVRLAIRHGHLEQIPLLFLGKTSLEDVHIYARLLKEEIVVPPKYVPHQFRDISALAAWMCYSLFLNKLSLDRLSQDYKKFF